MACRRLVRAYVLGLLLLVSSVPMFVPAADAAAATPEGKFPIQFVGASAAALDGVSYVLGGRMPDGSYSDGIYAFTHATGAVTKVGTLPKVGTDAGGRQSGTAVALAGKIYYFGGAALVNAGDLNNDGTPDQVPRAVNDIVEFTPSSGVARKITPTLPAGAWGMSSATLGGKAYLFGGFSFDFSRPDSIERKDWVLEFDGSKVRRVGTLPYAVQDAAAATIDNRIYLMGGLSAHSASANPCPTYTYYNQTSKQDEEKQPTACLTDVILSYNPGSGIASVYSKLPFRAQFLHAGVVDKKAYVAGAALSGPTATGSIVELDPSKGAPVRVLTPTLPRAVYGAPVTTDGKVIHVFGGRFGGYADLTDDIVLFNPGATLPWAPRSLVTAAQTKSVDLSWEPPTYDGGSPVTAYRVYRSGAESEKLVANVTGLLRYSDTSTVAGEQYVYRVTAVNAAGESATGARSDLRAQETPPGVVSLFDVYPANGELELRWLAPESTGGLNLSGYRIYRNGTLFESVGPSATRFVDKGLVNGVSYTYAVLAYNSKGDGPLTSPLTKTPAAVPNPPSRVAADAATGPSVRVTWDEPLVGSADGFVLYRGTEPNHMTALVNVSANAAREYVDSAVEEGRTYYYAISAFNGLGESPPTELRSVSLVTPPGPPAQLIVAPGQGEIRLTWQSPLDTGKADPSVLTYLVSRTDPGKAPKIIATGIKGNTYVDRFVQPGQEYGYSVTAMNPLFGNATEVKSATPKAVTNEPPTAVLAAIPPIAKAGETVTLDASQSTDPEGAIKSYLFDFADGSGAVQSATPTVTHAYATNGTYYPSVVVIDNRNLESPPVAIQVIIGETSGQAGDSGPPQANTTNERPGTSKPTPGAGVALVLVGIVAAALVVNGRRGRA